ncbi:MAG: LysE family translocator [Sulfolobales archaeon]
MGDGVVNFLAGLIYGFSLAVPPGPMNALIASRSLVSFKIGFLTGLGAMTADFILMIITYFTSNIIDSNIIKVIYVVGGSYMILLALLIAKSNPEKDVKNRGGRSKTANSLVSYSTSLALGLTNPYQILWWLSAGLSFLSIFGPAAITGLFIAILIWITFFPLLVRAGYYYGGRVTIIAIKVFSIAVLLTFAGLILYEGLWTLLDLRTR